jgi:ABC-type multidrug transport system ATPase subunit
MCVVFVIGAPELANIEVLLTLFLFFLAAILWTYCLSFVFTDPKYASGYTSTFFMVGFMVSFVVSIVTQLPSIGLSKSTVDTLGTLALVFSPANALSQGLTNYLQCTAFGFSPWTWESHSYSGFVIPTMLRPLVFLGIQFAIGLAGLILLEGNMWSVMLKKTGMDRCVDPMVEMFWICMERLYFLLCAKGGSAQSGRGRGADRRNYEASSDLEIGDLRTQLMDPSNPDSQNGDEAGVGEDSDVIAERELIDSKNDGAPDDSTAIQVVHLRKEFMNEWKEMATKGRSMVAVHDLSFKVRKGECFALLGTNGAGKSTTINMLLRRMQPTLGRAYVNKVDVASTLDCNKVFTSMGYCPQHNALFNLMTGEEMIDFFAALRGVNDASRPEYVKNCIDNADLRDHATRRCGTYSGGNKRKLSLAIAICGDPDLVVLDECSAGIDPAARRKLWRVVNGLLARGNTVVMTTHHMEEASHLGHKIAIMVDGKLVCLGAPQHLKTKYGEGYELSIKMRPGNAAQVAIAAVTRLVPAVKILETNGAQHARLGLSGGLTGSLSLADVFETMERGKTEMGIESFVLAQSDLEDVFLNLTESRKRRSGGDDEEDHDADILDCSGDWVVDLNRNSKEKTGSELKVGSKFTASKNESGEFMFKGVLQLRWGCVCIEDKCDAQGVEVVANKYTVMHGSETKYTFVVKDAGTIYATNGNLKNSVAYFKRA